MKKWAVRSVLLSSGIIQFGFTSLEKFWSSLFVFVPLFLHWGQTSVIFFNGELRFFVSDHIFMYKQKWNKCSCFYTLRTVCTALFCRIGFIYIEIWSNYIMLGPTPSINLSCIEHFLTDAGQQIRHWFEYTSSTSTSTSSGVV